MILWQNGFIKTPRPSDVKKARQRRVWHGMIRKNPLQAELRNLVRSDYGFFPAVIIVAGHGEIELKYQRIKADFYFASAGKAAMMTANQWREMLQIIDEARQKLILASCS